MLRIVTKLGLGGLLFLSFYSCSIIPGIDQDKDKKSGAGDAGVSGTLSVTTEDEASLPPCNESNQGKLAYVIASKSFFTCNQNAWLKVEIQGPQGDEASAAEKPEPVQLPGDQAYQIYQANRRGIFRLNVSCVKEEESCTDDRTYNGGFGTGFACGEGKICTNKHVLLCKPPKDFECAYKLKAVDVFQIPADADSLVDASGKELAPVMSLEPPTVKYSTDRDLAVIAAGAFPEGTPVLPLTDTTFQESIRVLDPILSLSFPLGFSDLYTDLGAVNTPDLSQCPEKTSKYGCIGSFYDFATTNDTDKGSSGSPLFNVRTGKVVGITSGGTVEENANFTWAIDASLLKALQQ